MIPDNPDERGGATPSRLPHPSRRDAIVIGSLIVAAAAVLVFTCIGCKSFWLDEATSYWRAHEPWGPFWDSVLKGDPSMALYYLLLRAWILLGSSEGTIRSFSAIFAIATVFVGYRFGSHVFGRLTGLVAAALLATNAFLIHHAQEARGYSQAAFLVLVATYLLARAVEAPSARRWAAWAVVLALAVASSAFAALVGLAHVMSLLVAPARQQHGGGRLSSSRGKVVVLSIAAVVAIAMIVLVLAPNLVRAMSGGLGWLPDPSLPLLLNSFGAWTGFAVPLLGIPLTMWAVAAWQGVREFRTHGRSWEAWRYAVLVSTFLVPIVVAFGFSFLTPAFWPRYLIVAVPSMCILAAVGVTTIRRPWIFWVALGLVLVLPAGSIEAWFKSFRKEDWRGVTTHVLADAEPNDVVFAYSPSGARVFVYYARRMDIDPPRITYPSMAWVRTDYRQNPLDDPLDAVTRTAARHDRVWLILSLDASNIPGPVPILRTLKLTHRQSSIKRFPGVSAILFERKDEPSRRRGERSRS